MKNEVKRKPFPYVKSVFSNECKRLIAEQPWSVENFILTRRSEEVETLYRLQDSQLDAAFLQKIVENWSCAISFEIVEETSQHLKAIVTLPDLPACPLPLSMEDEFSILGWSKLPSTLLPRFSKTFTLPDLESEATLDEFYGEAHNGLWVGPIQRRLMKYIDHTVLVNVLPKPSYYLNYLRLLLHVYRAATYGALQKNLPVPLLSSYGPMKHLEFRWRFDQEGAVAAKSGSFDVFGRSLREDREVIDIQKYSWLRRDL